MVQNSIQRGPVLEQPAIERRGPYEQAPPHKEDKSYEDKGNTHNQGKVSGPSWSAHAPPKEACRLQSQAHYEEQGGAHGDPATPRLSADQNQSGGGREQR
jgi:hypothetical protein